MAEGMKTSTFVLVELGLLAGIVLAAFTVPRSTSLLSFLIISGGFFALANVLLIRRKRRLLRTESNGGNLKRPTNYWLWTLLALYWAWTLLARFHHQ
ncbi:MAG: hypothetical protein JSS95_11710 [Acidobacteria bacterium]|nr:hypothetical protein [Acidobacteriota bacterium]